MKRREGDREKAGRGRITSKAGRVNMTRAREGEREGWRGKKGGEEGKGREI